MNCEWTKENIVLYIYEELADDAKFSFEHHVQHCIACKKEVEAALEFKNDMSAAAPVAEVSPNFLTASRMKLQDALEQTDQARRWGAFIFDFGGWLQQIKLAPALTMALLIIGFTGGVITTYRMMPTRGGPIVEPAPGSEAQANVAQIESITPQSDSNKVLITYDTLHQQTTQGDVNDPAIQKLLLLAARNQRDSDVRLDSIGVLTQRPADDAVREALIYALRYDKNPGVRLKAIDGLKSYVKDDVHVRDAVLEALMHDTNPGVRTEAIGLLEPVKADTSVREALQMLADHDQNKFIRTESKRYLSSTPNLD